MVFVIQHPRQKERWFLGPTGFEAPPGSSFPIDGDIPESLCASFAFAASATGHGPIQAGCIGIIAQLMNPFHKLTFCIVGFLKNKDTNHHFQKVALTTARYKAHCICSYENSQLGPTQKRLPFIYKGDLISNDISCSYISVFTFLPFSM